MKARTIDRREQALRDELLLINACSWLKDEHKRIRMAGKSAHADSIYWLAVLSAQALNALPESEIADIAKDRLVWPQLVSAFVNDSRPKTPAALGQQLPMKLNRKRSLDSFYTAIAAEIIERATFAWNCARQKPLFRINIPAIVATRNKERASLPVLSAKTLHLWEPVLLRALMDEYYPRFSHMVRPGSDNGNEVDSVSKRRNYFRKHIRQAIKSLLAVA